MRFVVLFLLSFCLLFANTKDINTKITRNKSALEDKNKQATQINAKLQKLGNIITEQEKESLVLSNKIKESEKNIAKNQQEYNSKNALIKKLNTNQSNLYSVRKQIESELINLILKEISFVILLNDFQPESIKDLIAEESFKTLSSATKEHIKSLSNQQSEVILTLQNLQKEITQLKQFIDTENQKRQELEKLQNQHITLIENYQKEVQKYNIELEKIAKERDALQKILVELNVLKSQEAQKQKKREALEKERKKQVVATKEDSKKQTSKEQVKAQNVPSNFDVRQVASSYHNISTTKYKGKKTIAPLDNYTIDKKFGPYFDPVYKMKVFNESITLTPKGDDKVKSVLDGKVVFAKDTPILKRVVIIEHKNNMHTIYAQLDKIAPTIKPGRSVKKGYTIGRVENALKFEVTLKDKHIDPLELIASK